MPNIWQRFKTDNFLPLNSNFSVTYMPKLQHETRTKKETTGIFRHDSYKIIIPYIVYAEFQLQDDMMLYATASAKTGTIRLHKKITKDCIPVKIRQKLTKTYRNQKYYSSRVTIPIQFIKDLKLVKGQSLDVDYTIHSITIKPARH